MLVIPSEQHMVRIFASLGSDFLVLEGALGVRAGPPEGYGPGTWFYEPSGARHDATQRVSDDDLIYTANIYGPLTFDTGPGTPVVAVLSWMEYVALAEAGGMARGGADDLFLVEGRVLGGVGKSGGSDS